MYTFEIHVGGSRYILQLDSYEQAARRAKEKFNVTDSQITSIVNVGPTIGSPNSYLQ